MVKRPRQHQLEDESRIRFADLLPPQWVYRDKPQDYGIDCEVEVFDEDNESTGLVFLIQLKGTDSEKLSTVQSISLTIDKIDYYKSLELPVLIARYSSKHQAFLIKWAHSVDTYYAQENSASYTIKYADEDQWTESTPEQIIAQIKQIKHLKYNKILLPISVHLSFEDLSFCGVPSSLARAQLISKAEVYSDFLIFERSENHSLSTVEIRRNEVSVRLGDLVGFVQHTETSPKTTYSPEELIKDIVYGLAASLSELDQADSCAEILFESDLIQSVIESKEKFLHILPTILKTSYFSAFVEKIGDFIETKGVIEAGLYTYASAGLLFNSLSQNKRHSLENLLHRVLARCHQTGDHHQLGIAYYNLGRHLGCSNQLREAIKLYLKAQKHFPGYLAQAYFNRELGGLFFEIGKYRFASYFYQKSLEQGCRDSEMLYADALMLSGRYSSAKEAFERGLSVENHHSGEWYLKLACLKKLTSKYKINSQSRNTIKANELVRLTKNSSEQEAQILLNQAIRADFLCSSAWFNMGTLVVKQGRYSDGCFCYLLCSLINREDIESWVNTFIYAFLGEVPIAYLAMILRTAFKFNRDEYLGSLYASLNTVLDEKLVNQASDFIEAVISQSKQQNRNFELRSHDEDEVSIVVPKQAPN